ncbi:Acetyltransferase (GNAT) family protein [Thermomonospora echinospora]|uniref:Acetyltransferase (GNAT) family protein n=1 Tax=Thermomonospora echinospora TaxID=1992 RepID=A0A1H6DZ90_9ACTN|nr:GNAT family N-acetyltransferase [Thermomonospora echinospora]SEG90670.1 Acetyltransferase (GNAT) family protein [Thermomonospora echinospora]
MRIEVVGYDHPDAARLIGEAQQEMVVRYGGPDETPVAPSEFTPPSGLFLVGYVDGVPVVCGGWRSHGQDAELKRMYVAPAARGNGYARSLLAEIERTARAAGHRRVILETGTQQPEAVALYRSAGYTDVPAFGYYSCSPNSIHLGKLLDVPASAPGVPGGPEGVAATPDRA